MGCGPGAKFGPNYVQCCGKSKEIGKIIRFLWQLWLEMLYFKDVSAKFLPNLAQKW